MKSYKLIPKFQSTCPVCLYEGGVILYSVDSEHAARHFMPEEVAPERFRFLKDHIEHLWEQKTCDIVRCSNCLFCYADPYVGGDSRFYELAYDRTGYPGWKWEFECTLNTLNELRETGRLFDFRLLEAGAGDGAFVKRIAPEFIPKQNVLCTEYSEYGVNAIRKYGIECRTDDIRALPAGYTNRFEVICMFQVLEHLDKLDTLFKRITDLSAPEAHLFIAVPNERRIEFNELHGSLLDMPPNHIGRWNRRSFEYIARRYGWQLIRHIIEEDSSRKMAQFIQYRYIRKRQERNTLANRIERISSLPVRRLFRVMSKGLYTAAALHEIYALMKTPMLGNSQWVHLYKNEMIK